MTLLHDTRGQTIGYVRFFAALLIGGALSYFVLQVTEPILDYAGEASAGTQAAQTTTWLSQYGEYMVVFFVAISFFGLIVLSLYQREVAR